MRVEAEQAAAEGASQARRELEQALLLERERAQADFETERERAQSELDAERQRAGAMLEAERQRARAQVEAERQRAESELVQARAAFEAERDRTSQALDESRRPAVPATGTSALLEAVRAIDAATSLSDALAAAVRGAALEAPRTALFIVSGTELRRMVGSRRPHGARRTHQRGWTGSRRAWRGPSAPRANHDGRQRRSACAGFCVASSGAGRARRAVPPRRSACRGPLRGRRSRGSSTSRLARDCAGARPPCLGLRGVSDGNTNRAGDAIDERCSARRRFWTCWSGRCAAVRAGP